MDWSNAAEVAALRILVVVNTIIKKIFIIKVREATPAHWLIETANAASDLNSKRWNNKFQIYTISNREQIQQLLDQIYSLTFHC